MGEPDNTASPSPLPHATSPYAEEAQMTSALYLAGEALIGNASAEAAPCAVPQNDGSAPPLQDFAWLRDLVSHIRQSLAEDPRRIDLLRRLPSLLGNGEILQVLFGNLFPEQRHQRKEAVNLAGKKRLTARQIEILRAVAQGKTSLQIAAEQDCTPANVNNILNTIAERLNTQSPQESVAVAISMGYLPLDVMSFVEQAAHCQARDFTPLDWQIASHGLEGVPDAAGWQELSAFGLFLMLATNTISEPLQHAAQARPASGVVYRLEPERSGAYHSRQIVGPGRLRTPCGIAIAPPGARRHGFTPGAIYILHFLSADAELNIEEIVEFAPDGEEQRAFRGGRSLNSRLHGAKDLLFEPGGALLTTGGAALLRFSVGGTRVQPVVPKCCTSVCALPKGVLWVAHSSSRGGSLGIYTPRARQPQTFAQLPMQTQFSSLQALPGGEVAALRYSQSGEKPEDPMMHIYDAGGEFLRCWRAAGASYGAFAFHTRDNCFYIPCPEPGDIAVYAQDGKLQRRLALDKNIAPYALTFDKVGTLWCVGSLSVA